jgi:DNA-binding CsgD family transcriptional regulator
MNRWHGRSLLEMAPDAVRGEILRLARSGLDFQEFARAGMRVLRRAVPFDAVAVVAFDPATGVAVDTWSDEAIEFHDADIERFKQLADSGRRAVRRSGELRAVCVGDTGMWGAILMRREPGAPAFTTRDVDLLASLSCSHPEVQRARLEQSATAHTAHRDPGLLLLDDADGVDMANAGAATWLDDLPDHGGQLPFVVTAVAERARAVASGHSDSPASARVRAESGRWVLVSGSVVRNGTRARTAVTLETARAPELAELIANAYGLTARERGVARLVAQGRPTAAIAARLHLSTYTVQDHLKAMFEKLGVSSRGELVATLFLSGGWPGSDSRTPERRPPRPGGSGHPAGR